MKRISVFILIFLGFFFCSASCNQEKEEWERFYGYTKADVIGHYEANPDSSLYEELPTVGVEVYPNAVIDITEYNEDMVNIHIVIPNVWYKNFRGFVALNENDSNISLGNDSDGSDILMTVYRNKHNQVRLHGRARERHLWHDPVSYDWIIYGFDVIKQPASENVAE